MLICIDASECAALNMTLQPDGESAFEVLYAVRNQKPLMQCITNFVSMVSEPLHATEAYKSSRQPHPVPLAGPYGKHLTCNWCKPCDGEALTMDLAAAPSLQLYDQTCRTVTKSAAHAFMTINARVLSRLVLVQTVQAHSYDEVEAFQQIAKGLVINVRTLPPDWVASMELAAKTANQLGKPWVLDPVGAGATPFRTQARHVTNISTDPPLLEKRCSIESEVSLHVGLANGIALSSFSERLVVMHKIC